MEEMGMTDMQFKSHLKGVVSNLEEIKREVAEPEDPEKARDKVLEKLDEMITRFQSDIES